MPPCTPQGSQIRKFFFSASKRINHGQKLEFLDGRRRRRDDEEKKSFQAKVKRAKAEEETLSKSRLERRKYKKAGQTIKLQKEVEATTTMENSARIFIFRNKRKEEKKATLESSHICVKVLPDGSSRSNEYNGIHIGQCLSLRCIKQQSNLRILQKKIMQRNDLRGSLLRRKVFLSFVQPSAALLLTVQ